MSGRPILTAAELRAAESEAIARGTPAERLMQRAGLAAAEAARRFAGPLPALVLCGPGNNGGDGYVIAGALAAEGIEVRVAALGEPQTPAARWARTQWSGPVEELGSAAGAPLLIDSLFGTGLTRPLDEPAAQALARLAAQARVRVAVDLPSGAATDDGRILSPVPDYQLTIAFGALKPSHLLQPAARHMGRIVVADIGVPVTSTLHALERPRLRAPGPDDHKYSRGFVAVLAGEMAGASALTAAAALRAGVGYVRLIGSQNMLGLPYAIVQNAGDIGEQIADPRITAIAVGPGLGRGNGATRLLDQAITAHRPLVLDADALFLLAGTGVDRLRQAPHLPIITPHAGEFARLFGDLSGSKIDQARKAAEKAGAVTVYKGADTVVACPSGRAAIASVSSAWLASAGTGDVLTGVIAAARAGGMEAFEAASAGVWLHTRAADHAGPGLIADDLLDGLPEALAECL